MFYIIGAVVVAAALDSLSSGLSGFGSLSGLPYTSGADLGLGSVDYSGLADTLLAFGVVVGALIIFGGVLVNSEIPGRRKAGGILVVVMIIVGSLTTLGGLLIGFILAGIGAYLGLTYKSRGMIIGLGPIGSMHLGQQGVPSSTTPAGSGPLNYCIKCGSPIRPGSVFCGACGVRIVE